MGDPTGSRGDATDAELVSAVIARALLCAECIVEKTGVPVVRVRATLETIAGTVKVTWSESCCDACLTTKTVFRLV